ncbi:MAG: GGDEF domain-containing protein [Lachnospiraceae bacterium]|nr:GGDEF domain-containing protein [Lachnospiraceae bacterium]
MVSVLTTANLIAALFIIIIIIGLYQVPKEASASTRKFRYCMWICFAGLIVEILAYVLDGHAELSALLTVLNFLGYALIDVLVIIYGFYLHSLVTEGGKKLTRNFPYLIMTLCLIGIVFLVAGTVTGTVFTIENGRFVAGNLNGYAGLMSSVSFFIMLLLYVVRFRDFRIQSRLFVVLIVVFPVVANIVLLFDPQVRFNFTGTAVSMNVVYVIIQSRIVVEVLAKAHLNKELSEKDILTGLLNRRGYQELLDGIGADEKVGIVFADVNSLKAVNDNEGHEAGDRLINRVALLLTDSVPDGSACRISGDEFVCIVKEPDEASFEKQMDHLRDTLMKNDRIASFGYGTGKGERILEVIKTAENMMYDDKERYYKETGKERRR